MMTDFTQSYVCACVLLFQVGICRCVLHILALLPSDVLKHGIGWNIPHLQTMFPYIFPVKTLSCLKISHGSPMFDSWRIDF